MKILQFAIITFVVSYVFIGCKKDHDPGLPPSTSVQVEGRWEGSYVNDASGNTFYYSFNIKPGGIIEEINSSGQKVGEGTWTYENNILLADYTWLPPAGSTFSVIGSYYNSTGKFLGNWGYENSTINGGTWEMIKK